MLTDHEILGFSCFINNLNTGELISGNNKMGEKKKRKEAEWI